MYIYIPQGKAGRLKRDAASFKHFGVLGLFTDNFSSCAYISCISKDKISLMHIDVQSCTTEADFRVIQQELEWVEGDKSIIITTRPDSIVKRVLQHMLQRYLPQIAEAIQWQLMDDEHDGLHVSLINDGNSRWHPQISIYPREQQPQTLLHHPQEDCFFYVQVIEQLIGLCAKQEGYIRPRKTLVIYDGNFCAMQSTDLKVDTSHPTTRHEMAQFESNTPLIRIAGVLGGIINFIKNSIAVLGETSQLAFDIAPSFESYLNPDNALGILKCNIRDFLNDRPTVTAEDIAFKKRILDNLDNETTDFQQLSEAFSEYSGRTTPISTYKTESLAEFRQFANQYQSREAIALRNAHQTKQLSIAADQLLLAMQHYRSKNYSDAYPLFKNVLQLHLLYSKNDNDDLGTAAYNVGRCLFQLQKYQEAIYFYKVAAELSPKIKTKVQGVIAESQQQLDETNTAVPSL